MKLIVLGSGTSVPHAKRSAPAYWLETSGGTLLLDISPDAAHRMAQESLDWPNLDAIWVSHFHLDHLGGLSPFLFGLRWAPQTEQRSKPLKIYGPQGLRYLLDTINDSNNYKLLTQRFDVEVIEVSAGDEFEILSAVIAKTLSTQHTQESMALRLTDAGLKTLVYTSDTGFAEDLVDFAKNADLLLMECSFRRNKPIQTHLDLEDAMTLARRCAPAKLVLTHLYPEWDGVDLATEARLSWSGNTIEATDGLRLVI
jgi:ribonuclease BN (tRNA processing enzyme)